jgi:small subunit ribosomal protein S8
MSMQDPISDMLTRVRNAQMAGKKFVDMPGSKLKTAVAQVLQDEGYIAGYSVDAGEGKPRLAIELKYYNGKPVIAEIERFSKPSLRRYAGKGGMPSVRNGLGRRDCLNVQGRDDRSSGQGAGRRWRSTVYSLLTSSGRVDSCHV